MYLLLAQRITNPALGEFGNQTGEQFLGKLIPAIVSLLMTVGIIAFLIMFIVGGISWITAGGDKGRLEGAKTTLSNALIGVVLILSFYAILSLVECFFGIGLRKFDIGPFDVSPVGTDMSYCADFSGDGGGGGNGGGSGYVGNPACPCSADYGGGCAATNMNAEGPSNMCYQCTDAGWQSLGIDKDSGQCDPISCGVCP